MWQSIPARVGYLLFLLGAVLFLPWWLVALLVLILLMVVNHFYEVVAAGFFFDVLYGSPQFLPWRFPLFATIGLLLLVPILEKIKKVLIFYA